MFNADQKYEYIEYVKYKNTHLKQWLEHVFDETESLEKLYNKDIGEWTSSEILSYYKLTSTSSFKSLNIKHSQLRSYANWCLARNLLSDYQNHYFEIDSAILHGCVNVGKQQNGMVTREELEKLMQNLLNPRDQCLLYAFFEGIQGQLFSELTDLNIDQLEGNLLHLATRTIPVSERFISLMVEATYEFKYYSYGENPRIIQYKKGDTNVFKMTGNSIKDSDIRKRQRLYSTLTRIRDYIGNSAISAVSLIESGRIDMIKKYMAKETNLNLSEILIKYDKDITNKYGKIYNRQNYILNYGQFYEKA